MRNGAKFVHSLDCRALRTVVEELKVFVGRKVGNDPAFLVYLPRSMPC